MRVAVSLSLAVGEPPRWICHRYARLDADRVVNALAYLHGASRALGNDEHKMRIARKPGLLDALNHVLLKIVSLLRHKHRRSSCGKADV